MQKRILYVSHDSADMKPISLRELTNLAFDSNTPEDYADYLNYVLEKATAAVKATGTPLKSIKFTIHENGAVYPFGEGGHSYCTNFFTAYEVDADCPLIPRSACFDKCDINPFPGKQVADQEQVKKFANENNVPVENVFAFIRPDTGGIGLFHS